MDIMPTGACGINCDVCRLNLIGLCTPCGPGKSREAQVKLAVQERIFKHTCPILSCAVLNHKNYCMRDCNQFPCANYRTTGYPFSGRYLDMQERRRNALVSCLDPLGKPIEIPAEHWETLRKKDLNLISSLTEVDLENNCLVFDFLNQTIVLDPGGEEIRKRTDGHEISLDIPLMSMTALSYFKAVDRLFPIGKDLISTRDMEQRLYFRGDHELSMEPILKRFAKEPEDFIQAIKILKGRILDMADLACVLFPFPRIPVYYLFWDLSGSHEPRLSILFDRSIESLLAPPIIWGLVNLVNAFLLSA